MKPCVGVHEKEMLAGDCCSFRYNYCYLLLLLSLLLPTIQSISGC